MQKTVFTCNLQGLNIPYISVLRALSALFKECVIYLSFLPSEITVKYAPVWHVISLAVPFLMHWDIFLVLGSKKMLVIE